MFQTKKKREENPQFPQEKKRSIVERKLCIGYEGIEELATNDDLRFFWSWITIRAYCANSDDWFVISALNDRKQAEENFVWKTRGQAKLIEETVREFIQSKLKASQSSQNSQSQNKVLNPSSISVSEQSNLIQFDDIPTISSPSNSFPSVSFLSISSPLNNQNSWSSFTNPSSNDPFISSSSSSIPSNNTDTNPIFLPSQLNINNFEAKFSSTPSSRRVISNREIQFD